MSKLIESAVAGLISAVFLLVDIVIINLFARWLHELGWLDLSWLKATLAIGGT